MEEVKKADVNTDTLLYVIYLLYKTNIITRHHIRHMLKVVKEPFPVNLLEYLIEEERKATV